MRLPEERSAGLVAICIAVIATLSLVLLVFVAL